MPTALVSSSTELLSLSDDERLDSLSLFASGGSLNGFAQQLVRLLQRHRFTLYTLSLSSMGTGLEYNLMESVMRTYLSTAAADHLEVALAHSTPALEALYDSADIEKLKSFSLQLRSDHTISTVGLSAACSAMRRMTSLSKLSLGFGSYFYLREIEAVLNGGALAHLRYLQHLNLVHAHAARAAAAVVKGAVGRPDDAGQPLAADLGLGKYLSNAERLEALNLQGTFASSAVLKSLAAALRDGAMPGLKAISLVLALSQGGYGDGLKDVLAALLTRKSVQKLYITIRAPDPAVVSSVCIAELIHGQSQWADEMHCSSGTRPGLRSLVVDGAYVTCFDSARIIEALKDANHGIGHVQLPVCHMENELPPSQFADLADVVRPGATTDSLVIQTGLNVERYLAAFAERLQAGCSLRSLQFGSGYQLAPTGAGQLLDALSTKCTALRSLCLQGMKLPPGSTRHLQQLTSLEVLRLPREHHAENVPDLALALERMPRLRVLSLYLLDLKGNQCQQLLGGLVRGVSSGEKSLDELQLAQLPRDKKTMGLLCDVVSASPMLRSLQLQGKIFKPEQLLPLGAVLETLVRYCDVGPMRVFRKSEARAVVLDALNRGPVRRMNRRVQLCGFRRAHEARRDAGMVFQAAAHGRPLELAKRLRLGRLAGGLEASGSVAGNLMSALEAARIGGHSECVEVLEGEMAGYAQ